MGFKVDLVYLGFMTMTFTLYIYNICCVVLCADSDTTCEPWEGVWAPGVSVSCMPVCLLAFSGCSTLRVTGADCSHCNGDYEEVAVQAVFSTLIGREDHSVAPTALLCHKEPARASKAHY